MAVKPETVTEMAQRHADEILELMERDGLDVEIVLIQADHDWKTSREATAIIVGGTMPPDDRAELFRHLADRYEKRGRHPGEEPPS